MVMIRLARFGARKQPYYRIVAIEKDRARRYETAHDLAMDLRRYLKSES